MKMKAAFLIRLNINKLSMFFSYFIGEAGWPLSINFARLNHGLLDHCRDNY